MREHAIPQDVTGYRFHIIGNMTLKQFAEVGAGVVLAIIFYNLPVLGIFRYILAFLGVAVGAAVAFVPFEERSLDHWLTVFIQVLYKPTKFYWQKQAAIPDAFLYTPPSSQVQLSPEVDLAPARRKRIQEFMQSVPKTGSGDLWETQQKDYENSLLLQFNQVEIKKVNSVKMVTKPTLGVRVRQLKSQDQTETAIIATTNIDQPVFSAPSIVSEQNHSTKVYQPMIRKEKLATSQVAHNLNVPEVRLISVDRPDLSVPKSQQQSAVVLVQDQMAFVQNQSAQAIDPSTIARRTKTNAQLPFPTPPTVPNKLVGMVLSSDDKLLIGAVVEIKDLQGTIVRAVKTNPLGQFFVTTPLNNGEYVVMVEKSGFKFDPQRLSLVGEVVPPIEIRGSTA